MKACDISNMIQTRFISPKRSSEVVSLRGFKKGTAKKGTLVIFIIIV